MRCRPKVRQKTLHLAARKQGGGGMQSFKQPVGRCRTAVTKRNPCLPASGRRPCVRGAWCRPGFSGMGARWDGPTPGSARRFHRALTAEPPRQAHFDGTCISRPQAGVWSAASRVELGGVGGTARLRQPVRATTPTECGEPSDHGARSLQPAPPADGVASSESTSLSRTCCGALSWRRAVWCPCHEGGLGLRPPLRAVGVSLCPRKS